VTAMPPGWYPCPAGPADVAAPPRWVPPRLPRSAWTAPEPEGKDGQDPAAADQNPVFGLADTEAPEEPPASSLPASRDDSPHASSMEPAFAGSADYDNRPVLRPPLPGTWHRALRQARPGSPARREAREPGHFRAGLPAALREPGSRSRRSARRGAPGRRVTWSLTRQAGTSTTMSHAAPSASDREMPG